MHNISVVRVKEFISKNSKKGKSLTSKINGFLKYYGNKIQLLDIQYQRTNNTSSALVTYKVDDKNSISNVYVVDTPEGKIWFTDADQYYNYLNDHRNDGGFDSPLMPEFD